MTDATDRGPRSARPPETVRDARDARRMAHNPATTGNPSARRYVARTRRNRQSKTGQRRITRGTRLRGCGRAACTDNTGNGTGWHSRRWDSPATRSTNRSTPGSYPYPWTCCGDLLHPRRGDGLQLLALRTLRYEDEAVAIRAAFETAGSCLTYHVRSCSSLLGLPVFTDRSGPSLASTADSNLSMPCRCVFR